MKDGIHPKYFPAATIQCACGATYTTGSTRERIDIELCAACHPFFTGKQKIIDSARRVEKFSGRAIKKAVTVLTAKEKKAKEAVRVAKRVAKKTAAEK